MIITILKRYDENGAWTHDIEARIGVITNDDLRNSQWSVWQVIDVKEILESLETLEQECENLTEENQRLMLRLSLLQYQN